MLSVILSYAAYFRHSGKREIDELRVQCKYHNCEWRGTFGTVEEHLAACKITLVPCPNDGCEDRIKRVDLHNHVKNECPNREHECERCKEKGTFQQMTQFHDQNCKKIVVECPNAECDKRFERCHSVVHLAKDCEYTKIPCKLCGIEVTRNNWAEHKRSDIHILWCKVARAVRENGDDNFLLMVLVFITSIVCAVLASYALNASSDAKDARELVASMQANINVLKSLNDSQTIQTLNISHMDVLKQMMSLSQKTTALENEFVDKLSQKTTALENEFVDKLSQKTMSLERKFNSKLADRAELVAAMDSRIKTLEKGAAAMEKKYTALDNRIKTLEKKTAATDKKYTALEKRTGALEKARGEKKAGKGWWG